MSDLAEIERLRLLLEKARMSQAHAEDAETAATERAEAAEAVHTGEHVCCDGIRRGGAPSEEVSPF